MKKGRRMPRWKPATLYLLAPGNPRVAAFAQPGRKHGERGQDCWEVTLSSMAEKRDDSLHKRTRGSWHRPEPTGPPLRKMAAVRRWKGPEQGQEKPSAPGTERGCWQELEERRGELTWASHGSSAFASSRCCSSFSWTWRTPLQAPSTVPRALYRKDCMGREGRS